MVEFGSKLMHLRKEKEYTQEDLANILHVSRQTVSKWERGESYPSYDILIAISKEFDISIDELVTGEDVRTMAIDSSNNVRKNSKITLILAVALIVILTVSLIGTVVAFVVRENILDWENNPPILQIKPSLVCGAVFVLGTRESDIFSDGEEFDLEKVQKSGFPYCIDMMVHDESIPYNSLFTGGMFGGMVTLSNKSWSGEFEVYYTKPMYMNIYLICIDDDGKLRLDNRLSFTWLRDSSAKHTITLNSGYYPKTDESFVANVANGVKIQFIYRNEVTSFTVEERTKDGKVIKSAEYASAEDFAKLNENVYYLDKETDFLLINEKTVKNGEEALYERIIPKTECEYYTYPILSTGGKGYATQRAIFSVNK